MKQNDKIAIIIINDKNSNKILFSYIQKIYLELMSLSTSKSKTQLAYARSGKAITKPKSKNNNLDDITKSNHNAKNTNNNIYDSIMGQIQSTQQDYIKNLIVKNQRETHKNERETHTNQINKNEREINKNEREINKNEREINKNQKDSVKNQPQSSKNKRQSLKQTSSNIQQSQQIKRSNDHTAMKPIKRQIKRETQVKKGSQSKKSIQTGSHKSTKHPESQKKIPIGSHDRTQSQALLFRDIMNQNQHPVSLKTNQQNLYTSQDISIDQNSKKNTQISCDAQQTSNKSSQLKIQHPKQNKKKEIVKKTSNTVNPIIEALNTSSSFAKKLGMFELQYPQKQQKCVFEERQQRSTHKKTASKTGSGMFFSCQTSPKNMSKNSQTQQIVVTTKPQINYILDHKNKKILPGTSSINSTMKNSAKKGSDFPPNFLSSIDQYLNALGQPNIAKCCNIDLSNPSMNMKRSNSNKIKQCSALNQPNSYTLGKYEQDNDFEQDTVVLVKKKKYLQRKLTLAEQNQLFKILEEQTQRSAHLESIISSLKKELRKFKKKQTKMKEVQSDILENLKNLDSQLCKQKNQRRKLEQIVKDFQSKIRGISRGKSRQRYCQDEQTRPQRKTIYEASSVTNSINYHNGWGNFYNNLRSQDQKYLHLLHKNTPSKIKKHSKNHSINRFSSIINNATCEFPLNYMNQDLQDDNKHVQIQYEMRKRSSKNKTQKINKTISSFQLEDHKFNERDNLQNYQSNISRNYVKNARPQTCKDNKFNSSMPNNMSKTRPMSPTIIQELFAGDRNGKNRQSQNYFAGKQCETQREQQEYGMSRENGINDGQESEVQKDSSEFSQGFEEAEQQSDQQQNSQQYYPVQSNHINQMFIRMR